MVRRHRVPFQTLPEENMAKDELPRPPPRISKGILLKVLGRQKSEITGNDRKSVNKFWNYCHQFIVCIFLEIQNLLLYSTYLIAKYTRLFFWQKSTLIRYLHVYSKTIESADLHHQKWLNREEPTSSNFLNNPNSNLKITASICLKNFRQKCSK